MAQVTSLALGRTAATSSVITVTTTAVTVSLYSDAADGSTGLCSIPGEAICAVYIDSPGTYNPQLADENGKSVFLTQDKRQIVLTAPGDYYVMRPLIQSTSPQVGVFSQT